VKSEDPADMHDVETTPLDPEFAQCWRAAGQHLQSSAAGAQLTWLKAVLEPPFLEHLSFRLGNQLFFVRIEDDAQRLTVPGSESGLRAIADACRGHTCLMPMTRGREGWTPANPGWGLLECATGAPIVPPDLTTEDLIAMTDWELHDFAVQTVRNALEKEGREIMSSQGNPSVDPSLWFVGDDGPEWVVVRAVRYPVRDAQPPSNWAAIAESCARLSQKGNFASVAVASAEDAFDSDVPPTPLWRGHGMYVSYEGLTPRP
jgi:hypothetical protein